MATDWKKTASLVFDTVSDNVQLVLLIVLPTPASSSNGIDKVRALHLSALTTLAILGIWLVVATRTAGKSNTFDPLFFIIMSVLFFTFVSWLVFGLLKATGLYDPAGQTITDALTLVIGFNLVATVAAAIIREADILLPINSTETELRSITMWGALSAALLFACVRVLIKLPTKSAWTISKAALVVLVLAGSTWAYLNLVVLKNY
jgi:hypothetical protein